MLNRTTFSKPQTAWPRQLGPVAAVVECALLALACALGCSGPALGAESASALESEPDGWVDILPGADLKGWYRVAVPPTGTLGRQQ